MLRAEKLFTVLDSSIEYIQIVNRCAMFEIANPNNETVGRDWRGTDWVRTAQTYLKRVELRANLLRTLWTVWERGTNSSRTFYFVLNIFNQNKSGYDRIMIELGLYANRINVIETPYVGVHTYYNWCSTALRCNASLLGPKYGNSVRRTSISF